MLLPVYLLNSKHHTVVIILKFLYFSISIFLILMFLFQENQITTQFLQESFPAVHDSSVIELNQELEALYIRHDGTGYTILAQLLKRIETGLLKVQS